MAAFGSSTSPMSFPASATELRLQARLSELLVAGSLELSPRELHRAADVAALLPANTCIYIPSLPGLPLARTLEAIAAIRAAGLDPVPHVSARRILNADEFRAFLTEAAAKHGVHRVLLVGGDEPRPKGPFADSLQILESGLLADSGIREIGLAGYPEGHPRICASDLSYSFQKKLQLARQQQLGVYVVTQFSFAPGRVVEYCARLARIAPDASIYVGVAGPTDPLALARYAQRCGVSVSLRALRNLGSGIARLVTHSDPRDQLIALARYSLSREPSNVVGVHLYSFGGAVKTASWMRELI
jgi:methylenetetrahydrofolate reductase (NADPH)